MPGRSFELYDLTRETSFSPKETSHHAGCYVTRITGFLAILVVVVLVVGVALLVFFVKPKGSDCTVSVQNDSALPVSMCQQFVYGGGSSAAKICSSCQAITTVSNYNVSTKTTSTTPSTDKVPITTTSLSPTDAWGAFRLPSTLKPLHYSLSLYPNIYLNNQSLFYFEGSVNITFTCVQNTSVITLHQDGLDINSSQITVFPSLTPHVILQIKDIQVQNVFNFYNIHLAQLLLVGVNYTVKFPYFKGSMNTPLQGLYVSEYTDGEETIYFVTSQMESTNARRVFPCFDEPAMRATFDITLVRQREFRNRSYFALSNTQLISSKQMNSLLVADKFQTSVLLPTYLLAFVVCDFQFLSTNISDIGVELRIYAPPNRIEEAEVAHFYRVQISQWFNQQFRPQYQTYLHKLDGIAVKGMPGAMENWGLFTYDQDSILYSNMSTSTDLLRAITLISHEMAHLWFGNQVSLKWWDYVWLKESFSSYLENYSVNQLYPEWKMTELTYDTMMATMQQDSFAQTVPLVNHVETPEQIRRQYNVITYTKGGCVVSMMHSIMGEHFIPALNVYLEKYSLGNTDDGDLFDTLDEYSANKSLGLNMTRIMDSWVMQEGYPLVKVYRFNGSLRFFQERFFTKEAKSSKTEDNDYKYYIPITFTTSKERNFDKNRTQILWLNQTHELTVMLSTEEASADWFIVNLQHKGYYRVQYETREWVALIKQLRSDHTVIDVINRATLIDDAWNLVEEDSLSLNIALHLIEYLHKEMSYAPWRIFVQEKTRLDFMLQRTVLYEKFKNFMLNLVDKPLRTLGLTIPANNTPLGDAFLKTLLIKEACQYEQASCVSMAIQQVSDWMNGNGNRINPNLRSTFYCTAVREGNSYVWNFFYSAYQNETNVKERALLLAALGCSKDPSTLMTYLDRCVPSIDPKACLDAVGRNRYGRDIVLNYIIENFRTLQLTLPTDVLLSAFSLLSQYLYSEHYVILLKCMTDFYILPDGITKQLDLFKNAILENIRWKETVYLAVDFWLQSAGILE